jgi:hypothetical protein
MAPKIAGDLTVWLPCFITVWWVSIKFLYFDRSWSQSLRQEKDGGSVEVEAEAQPEAEALKKSGSWKHQSNNLKLEAQAPVIT